MTTLAAALTNSATEMRVNAAVADPAEFYQIDDEVIRVAAVTTTVNGSFSPAREVDDTLWQIAERGVGATAAASHLSGATLTPFPGAGGGAGGVSVDNQVDPAAPITTLIIPSATINGDEATVAPDLGQVLTSGNDAGSQAIAGLADPTDPQDAATKAYVDGDGVPTLAAVLTAGNDMAASGPGEIVAKDAGVIRASMAATSGFVVMSVRDITEVEVSTVTLGVDTVMISVDSGAADMNIGGGDVTFHTAGGQVVVHAEGNIDLDPGAGALKLMNLPTADPVSAGSVWNDAGTLKISAG